MVGRMCFCMGDMLVRWEDEGGWKVNVQKGESKYGVY